MKKSMFNGLLKVMIATVGLSLVNVAYADASDRCIVFIHGIGDSAKCWIPMTNLVVKTGLAKEENILVVDYSKDTSVIDVSRVVWTVSPVLGAGQYLIGNFDTPLGVRVGPYNASLENLAQFIFMDQIDEFLRAHEYSQVNFVVHSMGGLILRKMVADGWLLPGMIDRVITLASPHYGQDNISLVTQTKEMHYGSQFIWNLANAELRVDSSKLFCLIGTLDFTVDFWSAALNDCDYTYVKKCHIDYETKPGICSCKDGEEDVVFNIVRNFLTSGIKVSGDDVIENCAAKYYNWTGNWLERSDGSILAQIVDGDKPVAFNNSDVVRMAKMKNKDIVYTAEQPNVNEYISSGSYSARWWLRNESGGAREQGITALFERPMFTDDYQFNRMLHAYSPRDYTTGLQAGEYKLTIAKSKDGKFEEAESDKTVVVRDGHTTVVKIPVKETKPVDYVFLIDSTGSMSGAINSVKANAVRLIQEKLGESSRNCRVAVADYQDYPAYGGSSGDYPFKARCGFTTNMTEAISAVNGITLGNGGDGLESVYTALWECIKGISLGGWRDEASKAIMIMCDAGPHDPEPATGLTRADIIEFANSMVLDPEKDPPIEIIQNGAKSSARSSLMAARLQAAATGVSGHVGGVSIYPVLTQYNTSLVSVFEPLALETGGKLVTSINYDSVADAVADVIEDAIAANGFEYDIVNVDETAGTVSVRVFGGSKTDFASIDWCVVEGSAKDGTDFVAPTGGIQRLSWAYGNRSYKTITIPIRTDSASSGNRFFSLVLCDPVNMGLGGNSVCRINIIKGSSTTPVGDGRIYVHGVSQQPRGGSVTGSGYCATGTVVRLTATPVVGNVFLSWNDGVSDAVRDINITNATDHSENGVATYVASFIPVEEIVVPVIRSAEAVYTMTGAETYWELEYDSMVAAELSCSGLPQGLVFDHGVVTGMPRSVGCYPVTFTVGNQAGSDTKTIDFNVIYKVAEAGGENSVTNGGLYMVIDLSGGTNTTHFPITYLDAVPDGGWTDEYKTEKLVLRRIEAGTFVMGLHTNEYLEVSLMGCTAHGLHEVTLTKPFYEGVFEVTQKQWELVMGNNPSDYKGEARSVHHVAYTDIRGNTKGILWPTSSEVDDESFIGRLRSKTGLSRIDLPTEAQWEYACRAGTDTGLNSGKNVTVPSDHEHLTSCPNFDEVGYYIANCITNVNADNYGPRVVGSFKPNAWGLYDCHGNVAEWCLDQEVFYFGYDAENTIDPVGLTQEGCKCRVLKGGGWWSYVFECVSGGYSNGYIEQTQQSSTDGFRIVLNDADDTPMAEIQTVRAASNVMATDGDFTDKVEVTWESTGPDAMAFVYRGEFEDEDRELIGTSFGNSFSDMTAVGGKVYYYHVVKWNGGEPSEASSVDTGYSRRIFDVQLSKIDCDYQATITNLHIEANVPWHIESDADWVRVPVGSAFGSWELPCLIEANTSSTNRYAHLLVTSDLSDVSFVIQIEQLSQVRWNIKDGTLISVDLNGATEIEIPAGVTTIGEQAFTRYNTAQEWQSCASLKKVVIPEGVQEIAALAFAHCGIETILIPRSVNTIGDDAFRDCTNMISVVIQEGVKVIGNGAFSFCSALQSVEIPGSVISIGYGAFKYCESLKFVDIPDGVTEIQSNTFGDCIMLENVVIGVGVTNIGDRAFIQCTNLRHVEIPNFVESVGEHAFHWCSSLESVMVGESVREIGACAFCFCDNLCSVVFCGNAPTLGEKVFYGTPSTSVAYAERSSTGWNVDVPGMWNGIRIEYFDLWNVAFDANGGTVIDGSCLVTNGCAIGELPVPTRWGYVFNGWYTEKLGGAEVTSETVIRESMTLYAHWTPMVWTVVFNASGGVVAEGTRPVAQGCAIGELPVPTYRGYVFLGWYTAVNGGTKVTSETLVTKNIALYAHWSAEPTFEVSFNANGGTVAEESHAVMDGSAMGEMPVPKRGGYAFLGWYTAAKGGTKVTAQTVVTENMTVYAHWTAAWTVTFNANGGTVEGENGETSTLKVPVPKGKTFGALGERALPAPTRAGYAFKGWFTKKSGGAKITTKTKVTKNISWYAQWTAQKYPIKIVKSGKGTVSGAGSKAYKSKVTLKAKAASGYVFQGWYKIVNREEGTGNSEVLVSQKTSYTITVPINGATYRAKFITKAEDKSGIGMTFYGVGFGADSGTGEPPVLPAVTNVCGVVTTWPIAASGLTAVSVTVTGQPKGMKYDAKKKAVTGVPSVANKSGTMKITVKSLGASQTWSVKWRTVPLPAFARGTFNGYSYAPDDAGDGGHAGRVTLPVRKVTITVSSVGKFTAKVGTLSLARTGWTVGGDGIYRATLTATRTVGTGKKAKKYKDVLTLTLDPEKGWLEDQVEGTFTTCLTTNLNSPTNADTLVTARRSPFGDNADAKALAAQLSALGTRSVTDEDGLVWKLKVSSAGVATITRTTGTGKNKKTTTATATVFFTPAENDGYAATAYFFVGSKVVVFPSPIWILSSKVQLWESGPYWASANIGADRPWKAGYYFWWGDTIGYKREGDAWVASDGSTSNFSFSPGSVPTYGKSIEILKGEGWITADNVLAAEHDAAQVHWGDGWRMPTDKELSDLDSKCDWTLTSMNGVNGYVVRGRGDFSANSIFLPCVGIGRGPSLYDSGSDGHYWSSVPNSGYYYYYCSWSLYFTSNYHYTDYYDSYRNYGFSVRPVQGFTK